jgi:hypothetical protein
MISIIVVLLPLHRASPTPTLAIAVVYQSVESASNTALALRRWHNELAVWQDGHNLGCHFVAPK